VQTVVDEQVQSVFAAEKSPSPPVLSAAPTHELQIKLKQLDRRDWSLWWTAAVILILLCLAVFSLSFPALWRPEETLFQENLTIAVRGLFGLVLLFTLFALHQQYLIKQLRSTLQAQIAIVGELHGRAETVERLSILDELTGLFNRRFAIGHLSHEIVRCERENASLIVVLIDLDDFKSINATYGRAAGDEILQRFAQHLKKGIRSADLPVRMGGDKFLIILPECSVADVYRPLERLRGCEFQIGSNTMRLKFSLAWVQSRQGGLFGELLSRAEEALNQQKYAKALGRAPHNLPR
jgi:diguanylate cyclase (GGDEF)-like protein